MTSHASLDTIISLCKRRGFVYQTAEIYGGLNGVYDFGPMGVLLNNNIKSLWINSLHLVSPDILMLDGALLGPHALWKASGHIDNFTDPMVDCLICKHRFRADEIDVSASCSHCGNTKWSAVRQFNLMFKTHAGATIEKAAEAYLRPESAQSIFVNFKNIITTNRIKIPFGVAQIGKAFRNEITPKQFLFRVREFEQMELEWFCQKESALKFFEEWRAARYQFFAMCGINSENLRFHEHSNEERAHYALKTTDIEYQFPFGWKELEGISYRGDYDLRQHSDYSGKELTVYNETTKKSYIPHVVECSLGIGRCCLALLCNAYAEEQVEGESRIVLRFNPKIAPIKAAFLPLMKKLSEPMHTLYHTMKCKGYSVQFDDSGSIGKRYRRQDEIGTPLCITFDFESLKDNCVTVRDRDTMQQERININMVEKYIVNLLS